MRRSAWALWLTLPLVVGCTTIGAPPSQGPPAVRDAGGFHLQLWILGEENYAVVYEVNGDREIGFGGGEDALVPRLSWTGTLPAPQYQQLWALLEQHGWLDGSLTATGDPAARITRISLRSSRGNRRYKLEGHSDGVEPVADLLRQACLVRLDPDLDGLPQPQ